MFCWKPQQGVKEIKQLTPIKILIALFLVFSPIVSADQAVAITKSDYDKQVAAAKAKVASAQDAYDDALLAYENAQADKVIIDKAVIDAQGILDTASASIEAKNDAVNNAQTAYEIALSNYNSSKIIDPNEVITDPSVTIPGLQADIYNFDTSVGLPTPDLENKTLCKTIVVPNIDKDWGDGDMEGCGGDFVAIHYTGFITVPTNDNYEFLANVDDGWVMSIDGTLVNDNWVLKGCGGWWSSPITLEGGRSYPIDAWMYEWGGGACNILYYLNSQTWGVVPAEWLSQNPQIQHTYIKDPALLVLANNAKTIYDSAVLDLQNAQQAVLNASVALDNALSLQLQNSVTIVTTQDNVSTTEQELNVAQQELEAIPPFKEPTPTPEKTTEPTEEPVPSEPDTPSVTPTPPTPDKPELPVDVATVDPKTLSNEQVAELISVANEILNNSTQGSPEYEQALEALFVAAQADDIVLSKELAAIPGAEALIGAINFMGNVGADMSPKVREQSKKVVVTAVVAVGAAVNAATGAALMAAPAGGTNIIRRKI